MERTACRVIRMHTELARKRTSLTVFAGDCSILVRCFPGRSRSKIALAICAKLSCKDRNSKLGQIQTAVLPNWNRRKSLFTFLPGDALYFHKPNQINRESAPVIGHPLQCSVTAVNFGCTNFRDFFKSFPQRVFFQISGINLWRDFFKKFSNWFLWKTLARKQLSDCAVSLTSCDYTNRRSRE